MSTTTKTTKSSDLPVEIAVFLNAITKALRLKTPRDAVEAICWAAMTPDVLLAFLTEHYGDDVDGFSRAKLSLASYFNSGEVEPPLSTTQVPTPLEASDSEAEPEPATPPEATPIPPAPAKTPTPPAPVKAPTPPRAAKPASEGVEPACLLIGDQEVVCTRWRDAIFILAEELIKRGSSPPDGWLTDTKSTDTRREGPLSNGMFMFKNLSKDQLRRRTEVLAGMFSAPVVARMTDGSEVKLG